MSLDHAEYYQVARDIALGMNYLHSHKPEVLHLDLKSMNVLLCQSFRAKIADFGFSKLRYFFSKLIGNLNIYYYKENALNTEIFFATYLISYFI